MRRTAFLLLLPLPLAACSASGSVSVGGKTVDDEKVETFISKTVRTASGQRVTTTCPGDVEAKDGKTFSCTVKGADGSTGRTAVLITNAKKGSVRFDAPFVHIAELQGSIAASVKQQTGTAVQVDCPDVVLADAGDEFECDVAAGSAKRTALVTRNPDGAQQPFHYRLK